MFVTGMLTKWMSVSARPIASAAKPFEARLSVVPMIIEFVRAKSAARVAIEETEEVVEDLIEGRD